MNRSKLRKRKPINYYESDEPLFDEYIYCENCYDFTYEYCAIHGPLLVIPDNKVTSRAGIPSWVPRAALTTPTPFLHIAPSGISGAGLGVFSSLTLPRGVRFGPYRGKQIDDINSMYCWQISSDASNSVVDGSDGESSNWMRYVNCARHWHEQNLVAFQYQGQIYYRTVKIIPKFTELLVFYGGEFAHALGIDLKNYNNPQKFTVGKYIVEDNPVEPNENPQPYFDTEVLEIFEETLNIDGKQRTEESTFINAHIEQATGTELYNTINTQNNKQHFDTTLEKDSKNEICDICDKIVRRKNFKRHKRTHEKESLYCSYNTINTQNNKQNFETICDICDKIVRRENFRRHKRTHEKKSISCSYNTLNTQNNKQNFDTTLEKYCKYKICDICDKIVQLRNFKRHKRIHENKSLFCSQCTYKTHFSYQLVIHMKNHTKDEIYECDECTYVAYNKSYFRRHYRTIHKKVLTALDDLSRYNKNITGDSFQYKCKKCEFMTYSNNTFYAHLETHKSDFFQCDLCSFGSSKRRNIVSHIKKIHMKSTISK